MAVTIGFLKSLIWNNSTLSSDKSEELASILLPKIQRELLKEATPIHQFRSKTKNGKNWHSYTDESEGFRRYNLNPAELEYRVAYHIPSLQAVDTLYIPKREETGEVVAEVAKVEQLTYRNGVAFADLPDRDKWLVNNDILKPDRTERG